VRTYAVKTQLLASSGDHLRYLPGALARSMVNSGTAEIANQNGKVRSIRLIATATTFARRIGEATPGWTTAPYSVRERLECGGVIWRHHSRCFW
jgi:hypothetical protein